jgi:hypothetical protein
MNRTMRIDCRRGGGLALLLVGLLCVCGPSGSLLPARGEVSPEYKVKATMLFNFVKFVEWPDKAFADKAAPLVIGVLGEDPFGEELEAVIRDEVVHSRLLTIKRSAKVSDLKDCHLLFVGRARKEQLTQILVELDDAPILTVGDGEGFARMGGVINFVLEADKIRFEVNLAAARRKELELSSQMLRLGKIIDKGH